MTTPDPAGETDHLTTLPEPERPTWQACGCVPATPEIPLARKELRP